MREHTKVLELSDCEKLSDLALEKILKQCKYLTKIDLNSNSIPRTFITSSGVSKLAMNCKYLQVILLRKCINVDDDCIEIITKNCPMLKSLNIANCPLITDKSLRTMGKYCKFLKSINLSGTKVSFNKLKFKLKTKV